MASILSQDQTICIWNAETGEAMGTPLRGHSDSVDSVAFSPDGKHFISGSADRKICIWDAETWKHIAVHFEGHTDVITSLAFSPDGKSIISGSGDKTIHIWDAKLSEGIIMPIQDTTTVGSNMPVRPKIHFSSNPYHALCEEHLLFENVIDTIGDWRDSIKIQQDRWILGPQTRLLLWIPHMYFQGLYTPRTKCVIGIVSTELDLSHFAHGPLWQSCCKPNVISENSEICI